MKICWDNLERVRLSKKGDLKIGKTIYVEMESCKICGDPYLVQKQHPSLFCGNSCAIKTRVCTIETRKKMSEAASKRIGILNPNYKGGVKKLGLTTYDIHKDTLGPYEEIRKQNGTEVLEAKCVYCGKWHAPNRQSVSNRLIAINNLNKGEYRFYCSENCKQTCPTYGMHKYPKGFKHTTSREVSTYLRKMVLERDNWTCQICGKTAKEAQLHCHHMDPATQNPMFQNDMDSCITLCKACHKMVHRQRGCRYIDLRCKKDFSATVCSKDTNLQI